MNIYLTDILWTENHSASQYFLEFYEVIWHQITFIKGILLQILTKLHNGISLLKRVIDYLKEVQWRKWAKNRKQSSSIFLFFFFFKGKNDVDMDGVVLEHWL